MFETIFLHFFLKYLSITLGIGTGLALSMLLLVSILIISYPITKKFK